RDDANRKREPDRAAWQQSNALPKAHDRIEHDARRAGQRTAIEGHGVCGTAAAAEKPRPIGFPLDGALSATFQAQSMEGPRRQLMTVAGTSMTQERRARWYVFGFDE